jgi:hypothetical protein
MFKSVYDSAWHNPGAFVLANAALLLFALRARGGLRAFLLVFTAEILLDTTLTNAFSPIPKHLASTVAIPFVLLGDARVLILFERIRAARTTAGFEGPSRGRATLLGLALALLVPVAQSVALALAPGLFVEPRRIFLAYELLALLGLLGYRIARWEPAAGAMDAGLRRWGVALWTFVTVQYALWASADAVILAGHDVGFALRIVPNAMYYIAFLPLAWALAPPALRGEPARLEATPEVSR